MPELMSLGTFNKHCRLLMYVFLQSTFKFIQQAVKPTPTINTLEEINENCSEFASSINTKYNPIPY